MKPGCQGIEARMAAVKWALREWIDEDIPQMLICGKDCPVLLQGFQGAYRFREWQTKNDWQRDLKLPVKDKYSHPQDALQYALVEAKRRLFGHGPKVYRRGT